MVHYVLILYHLPSVMKWFILYLFYVFILYSTALTSWFIPRVSIITVCLAQDFITSLYITNRLPVTPEKMNWLLVPCIIYWWDISYFCAVLDNKFWGFLVGECMFKSIYVSMHYTYIWREGGREVFYFLYVTCTYHFPFFFLFLFLI